MYQQVECVQCGRVPTPDPFETVWEFLERTEPWVLEDLEDRDEALAEDQDRALAEALAKGIPHLEVPAPDWLQRLGRRLALAFPQTFLLEFYPAVP